MPNWCNNTLELQHKDPTMIERARAAMIRGEFLHEFIPVPKELSETVAGSFGDTEEQAKLLEQTKANIEKFGYGNWYDFCVNEWGTKWDIGGNDYGAPTITEDGKMIAGFDSAWSPPTTAMEKLAAMGFEVKLYYYEPGMCFAGIWEGNEDYSNDDYYEYGDMSSDEVAEQLPAELNDMFCISDTMAEYEDEENQEIDLDDGLSATNE
jgi:hypothetical protein